MLVSLRVKNFVLIEELELNLGPGLNVLTGETGAGKSILVDAIGLLLGGRGSPDLIRQGTSEAEVEALFDLSESADVAERLAAAGTAAPDGELVVRRVVLETGRSRAYVNGRLATVADLATLGALLVDIASQHESVSLTDPSTHLGYLDAFASLREDREVVAREVDALRDVAARAKAEADSAKGRAEREAFLRFQLAAIDDVAPVAGEEEALAADRGRLRHADKILDVTRRGASTLEDGEDAIGDRLASIAAEVRGAASFDPSLAAIADMLDAARAEVVEAARELSRASESVDADPSRLSQIEERLFALQKLKRQYGGSIDEVIAAREKLAKELETLGGAEERLAALEKERAHRFAGAAKAARALSKKRVAAADRLAKGITRELAALGMGSAKVTVSVAPLEGESDESMSVDGARLSRDGVDRVEFLIAPNKGVDPRPLRKVASGGELSRALLALKRVLADMAPAGTYVFDEVDTGVGGAIAERIGRALADVARHRQVLAITHLAPIAAFGTSHFVVEKGTSGDSTRSTIAEVKGKARTQEIARMISGATVTDAARKAALELLRAAEESTKTEATKDGRLLAQPRGDV